MSLLHLDSSAHRSSESVTRDLTALFVRHWRSRRPATAYRHRDLVARPVVPIGEGYCALGRRVEGRGGTGPVEDLLATDDERREWALTRELVDELRAADVLVVGAPMYNYAAPAALKAWTDRVGFPGAFVSPADGASTLADLAVVVVTSCGGAYGPGTGAGDRDFLRPWLRVWFTRLGVRPERIGIVTVDMALAGVVPGREHLRPQGARSLAAARRRLVHLAAVDTEDNP